MNFDIDLETENAKQRFMYWLDQRVKKELSILNFWYYYNELGVIFLDNEKYIPIGKPVIFGTGGGFDCDSIIFKQIWAKPESYKLIDNSWSESTGYFVPKYIMGVDPID